ncbi:MAG: hypothetical protein RL590_994 [Actinomycetota bacterium]
MIRLLVIDDHEVVRQGLLGALKSNGFETIETADSLKEARSKVASFNPQALIVDLNLPDGSGLDLVQWVRKLSQTTAIIVLSLNAPEQFARISQSAGANAFLSKTQSIEEILAALNFAIKYPYTFTSTLASNQFNDWGLTAREIDVLTLLATGSSNADISRTLYISLSTVKTHISALMRKLDASNRTGAVKLARDKGLLL